MTEYKAPELEVIMFACEEVSNTSGYDGTEEELE